VTIIDGDNILIVSLGQTVLYVNNRQVQMNAAPLINNGHVYLPFRYFAQALGYEVKWDANNRAVILGSK